jgi:hypothetical protein
MSLNAMYCPDQPSLGDCENRNFQDAAVVAKNLTFTTVTAAFGHLFETGEPGFVDGSGWVAFATQNNPITGEVDYYSKGDADTSPTVQFKTPGDASLSADQWFLAVHYHTDGVDACTEGTLSDSGVQLNANLPGVGEKNLVGLLNDHNQCVATDG